MIREAKGVEIPAQKGTVKLATVTMPVPKKITLLMRQHLGAPCKPVVAKGDKVDVGTLVGRAEGLGADIHSGVSGTVSSIEQIMSADGILTDAVAIESDGQQTIDPNLMPPVLRDKESFLQAVRTCGLVGLGGAGFPTATKLDIPTGKHVDTLIVNAAECEPFITSDEREMLECGNYVLLGTLAVKKYLNIERVVVAIERNKPEATELMFSLTKGDDSLVVFPLPEEYPQGAEKVLIEKVTGREVPAGGLPADVGVVMMNVTTVSTLGKYLAGGMPLATRRITVDGEAVVEPKNVDVIIGTPIADVIEFCGGYKVPPAKLLVGGPMMGIAMADDGYPITKQNNAILALSRRQANLPPPQACVRCGRCVSACPVGLSPIEICEAYEARDVERLHKLAVDVCFSCGTCSYVCPAKRLVSQTCTLGRAYYLKIQKGAKAK
jgi:electron transport complex protein RnfC